MTDKLEGPEALIAFRLAVEEQARRERDERKNKFRHTEEERKLVARFLQGEMGQKLMDLIIKWYDGDTFDTDPYQHAFNAGARAVVSDLKSLRDSLKE